MFTYEDIQNWETIKDSIVLKPRPIHAILDRYIKRVCDDIAAEVHILFENEGDAFVSGAISKDLFNSWNVSEDAIFATAFENDKRIYGYVFDDLGEMIQRPYKEGVPKIWVVHSANFLNGAVFMFDPAILEEIKERIGDDYYVSFTSRHEAMIQRKSDIDEIEEGKDALWDSLADTIKEATTENDFLTSNLYEYSDGKLRMLSKS